MTDATKIAADEAYAQIDGILEAAKHTLAIEARFVTEIVVGAMADGLSIDMFN